MTDVFARIASLASQSIPVTVDRSMPAATAQRSHEALDARTKIASAAKPSSGRSAPLAKVTLTADPVSTRKQQTRRDLPPSATALSAKAQARANTHHRTTPKPVPELKAKGKTKPPSKTSPLAQVESSAKSSASKSSDPSRGPRNPTLQNLPSYTPRQSHAFNPQAKLNGRQPAAVPAPAVSRASRLSPAATPTRRDPVKTKASSGNETPRPTAASEALEMQVKQLIERLDALERMPGYESVEQMRSMPTEGSDEVHAFDPYQEPEQLEDFEQLDEAEELRLEHRTSTISVRLNEAEFATLRLRAMESGISVSAYMRSCVLEAEQLRAQVKQALHVMRTASVAEATSETQDAERSYPKEERGLWSRLQGYTANLWRPQLVPTLKA